MGNCFSAVINSFYTIFQHNNIGADGYPLILLSRDRTPSMKECP